jgi:hypothetical protein
MSLPFRRPLLLALVTALTACGTGPIGPGEPAPAVEPSPFAMTLDGDTARAVLPLPEGVLVFREPIGGGLVEHDVRRTLTWLDERGTPIAEVRAGANELFLDVVTHPSGESTLFVMVDALCGLRRYGADGTLLGTAPLTEPDLVSDPTDTSVDPFRPWNVGGCQPHEIRETGRLAADGEHVYLVNRGGSHGIVLFRFEYGAGAFTRTLRKALLPRHAAPLPTGIMASHRVLRSTHWSYVPRVVVDDAGRARVLLTLGAGVWHEVYNAFAEVPVAEDARGVLLTVTRAGELVAARELPRALVREGTTSDIEGLRWLRGGVVLVGRVSPTPLPDSGYGWDGFLVHLVDGEAAPRLRVSVDLERGAVLSDAAAHGETGWLVAGRSGYWQNPRGASISEEGTSELLVLDGTGTVSRRLELAQGPRHNGALGIAPAPGHAGHFYAGGLANGPGSHSADTDPTLLQADGWVNRVVLD